MATKSIQPHPLAIFFTLAIVLGVIVSAYTVSHTKTGVKPKANANPPGIESLAPNDLILVQCLGTELTYRNGKLTNPLWTGTEIGCKKPTKIPAPTMIITPTPYIQPVGYYRYRIYTISSGGGPQFTCDPNPGRAPKRTILPAWGKTAVLLSCQ